MGESAEGAKSQTSLRNTMVIGEKLKAIRESKKLSQGDVENRTGLLRCYISRVENGHTVPSLETLQKFAKALDLQVYQLFHDGDGFVQWLKPERSKNHRAPTLGKEGRRFAKALAKLDRRQCKILLAVAQKLAGKKKAS
jgi:transcriptional regulator with XRE-family HTH domain